MAIELNSINSGEIFGSLSLVYAQTISVNTIVSGEFFGSATITKISTPESALPYVFTEKQGDIRISADVLSQFIDFILVDRDIERDDGMETAVLITLLTDKYADNEDLLPDDQGYRGGWFGDTIPVEPDYKIGTKLWLLQRAKLTSEIPALTKEYLQDGFSWMIEDNLCEYINIDVEIKRDLANTIAFTIEFIRPKDNSIFYQFYYNWENQLLRSQ